MSGHHIIKTFDSLVESWEAREGLRYDLEEYQRTHTEPEPPPTNQFEGLAALINYNEERWRYEQALEDLRGQYARKARRFDEAAQKVKDLLPRDYLVYHTYAGGDRNLRGKNYTVHHTPPEKENDSSEVVVRQGHASEPV